MYPIPRIIIKNEKIGKKKSLNDLKFRARILQNKQHDKDGRLEYGAACADVTMEDLRLEGAIVKPAKDLATDVSGVDFEVQYLNNILHKVDHKSNRMFKLLQFNLKKCELSIPSTMHLNCPTTHYYVWNPNMPKYQIISLAQVYDRFGGRDYINSIKKELESFTVERKTPEGIYKYSRWGFRKELDLLNNFYQEIVAELASRNSGYNIETVNIGGNLLLTIKL